MPAPTNIWEFMHYHPILTVILAALLVAACGAMADGLRKR